MSIAERADALEIVNDWDDLDTPEADAPAEVQPQQHETQPDPEVTTQDQLPQQEQADPATPVAETTDQRLARLEAIAAQAEAERARLQKIVDNHEYSAEGRLRIEREEKRQLAERLQSLEAARLTEDEARKQQYDAAIAQQLAQGNEQGAERLRLSLRAEMAERALQRERDDKATAQRHAQELQQSQVEHERTARGRQVQQAFIPTMVAEAQAAAQQYGLDEGETADLLAYAAPKSLQNLALNAPPEVLGQLAMQQYEVIVERAQALQQRKVQRNQQNFDTTRERGGSGSSRDLAKEFDEADDWDAALAAIDAGYVEPQSRHRGARRR